METYAKVGDKFRFEFSDPSGSGNGRGMVFIHTIKALCLSGRYVTYTTDKGGSFTYEINERPAGFIQRADKANEAILKRLDKKYKRSSVEEDETDNTKEDLFTVESTSEGWTVIEKGTVHNLWHSYEAAHLYARALKAEAKLVRYEKKIP